MAGWSMLDDGLVVDIAKTPQKLEPDGFFVDLELVSEERGVEVEGERSSGVIEGVSNEIQCCFDQFLRRFLKEICARNYFRPIPPMLGNGQPVNLYKLFMVVKEKGGYDAVSKNRLWNLVGEKSGLGMSIGSLAKLIYSKYLSTLETWLKKVAKGRVPDCGLVDNRVNFGSCLMELQAEVKGVLSDYTCQEVGNEVCRLYDLQSEYDYLYGRKLCDTNRVKSKDRNGRLVELDMPGHLCSNNRAMETLEEFGGRKTSANRALNAPDVENLCNNNEVNSRLGLSDGGKRCDSDDDGILILDPSSVNKNTYGRKRKRESMWEMLCWITGIAKNPCDPVVGSIPERLKWKFHSNEENWKQVLLFREAVFLNRHVESSSEHLNWQSQKMHPCMYGDHLGATYNLRERLKCDKRTPSPLGSQGDLERTPSPRTEDRAEKRLLDSSTANLGLDKCSTICIPLGPYHQAEVPEWTGITTESDPKWLGTQIWPSEKVNHRLLVERDLIGKGRQDSCGCKVPGSVECVRFHIAEKRAKAKLELDVAFYQWHLDKVGEDVSHLWTEEEEKKFKDVVQSNPPSLERYFWDHIFRSFPKKSREDLVSYYFNVFLLQRRGYQNRHTPNNIDSDDDESESGPLRKAFGNQAQKSPISILLSPKEPQTVQIASEC